MADQAVEPWRTRKRPRGQCSSSSAVDDYDVFLNHRGPDMKAGFLAHLDEALRFAGLNPFLDKASLRKGDPAFRSIDDALEVAKAHVAVVSRGYAESKYCLSELVAIMRSGKPVIPVFYDVEPLNLRWVEDGPFAAAFEKHKRKKSPEQVEKWRDALRKLADITGFCFRLSDYMGDEVELKNKVVAAILNLIPAIEAVQVEAQMVSVEVHVVTCVNKLDKMQRGATCLLGLVGMGGIGKTSLAKEIYNHYVGEKKFRAMSFLQIERHSPSSMDIAPSLLSALQKQLLWDLLRVPASNMRSYNYWFHKISSRGPVLIILDDIHHKAQFDKLILDTSLLACGSCIIVTSRDRHLLKVIGGEFSNFYVHEVLPLDGDASQRLFNLHAFHNEEAPKKFEAVANIVRKACGGLPLALKVVGSSLFDKRSDEDLEHVWLEAMDALKRNRNIMNALKWSYDCLSEPERLMFVDIACIFHGWRKQEALEIWSGCKECSSCCGCGTPYTSLGQLIDKSLIILGDGITKGNDVLTMHSLLQELGKNIGMCDGSHLWDGRAARAMQDKFQGSKEVRALNLANCRKYEFEAEHFAKVTNLHYLILDGCNVRGDIGMLVKELRWLRWRYMPMTHVSLTLELSNLISLDFSFNTKLGTLWAQSNPALEVCPNLLRLDLKFCTSITTLPDSIGQLTRLQHLNLMGCGNLQRLPTSIGQLTALQELLLHGCGSLEALPDSITALPRLEMLFLQDCRSMSKLPTTMGLMTSLTLISVDLVAEWQAVAIGHFHALKILILLECTDEAITVLDGLGTLRNLDQLSTLYFLDCSSMAKLPETIGLLTNLKRLEIMDCEKVHELPNSIGQLKVLVELALIKCSSLETLPEPLGALTSLRRLCIEQCTSLTKLPASMGCLSSLCCLIIVGCGELQRLPDSLRQLYALVQLTILDCGSLEGLGALRVLQGLRMWGCTSMTELPGSCLMVVDSNFIDPGYLLNMEDRSTCYLKEVRELEAHDCGVLRQVQDTHSGRIILQRVYNLPGSELTGHVHLSEHLAIEWQADGMIGQLNALKKLGVTECTDEAITVLDGSGTLRNLEQLSYLWFHECPSMTKLPETMGLLTNLDLLDVYGCEKVRELPNSVGELKVLRMLRLRTCINLETLPESLGALTCLQRLHIVQCTALTKLPTSLGHLCSLWDLVIDGCHVLQGLPDSLGQLEALQSLSILDSGSLEDLGVSRVLQGLRMWGCTSITELPGSCLAVLDANFWDPAVLLVAGEFAWVRQKVKEVRVVEANDCGFLRHVVEDTQSGRSILQRVYHSPCRQLPGLTHLNMDLATEWQAVGNGEVNALEELSVTECTDEAITALDGSGTLRNLDQLSEFVFYKCLSMTKLPETIGVLANLDSLALYGCEKLLELPNSIGQLKALKTLSLEECSGLETLPDSMGALTSLQILVIVGCTSITILPTSTGHLSSLRMLAIVDCTKLQALPNSLMHLDALRSMRIMGCGSLGGLGALRVLQGLRIWGCTSITELPGSCLIVVETDVEDPVFLGKCGEFYHVSGTLEEVRVVGATDCGMLRQMQCTDSGELFFQRIHMLPCCNLTTV